MSKVRVTIVDDVTGHLVKQFKVGQDDETAADIAEDILANIETWGDGDVETED